MIDDPNGFLRGLFDAALAAVAAERRVPPCLPPPPGGRTVVVGAGKAAAAMARAVENNWPGALSGIVVAPYGHAVPCDRIEVIEAAHPVPDAAGVEAARRLLDAVAALGPDDLVIALMSGGGSALLASPAPGITLADKQALTTALLKSGAPIGEMNAVRKHLSAIKGGRLATAAWPAPVTTLVVSDVPGDDPATVASGPTLGDATTLAEARAILDARGIAVPPAIARHLEKDRSETPGPDDTRFAANTSQIVARAADALAAAAACADAAGVEALILSDDIEGAAHEVAQRQAALALDRIAAGQAMVLLSGGETTVRIEGDADGAAGGRNTEFALALALSLNGRSGISALACDTDGIDGAAGAAGAVIGPDTLARATRLGLDAPGALARHQSAPLFRALGALVETGPTRTNVNDFRAILIDPNP
ncbi:MAG: glycerate kinase [Alphaproteobacteria bacterium]